MNRTYVLLKPVGCGPQHRFVTPDSHYPILYPYPIAALPFLFRVFWRISDAG